MHHDAKSLHTVVQHELYSASHNSASFENFNGENPQPATVTQSDEEVKLLRVVDNELARWRDILEVPYQRFLDKGLTVGCYT